MKMIFESEEEREALIEILAKSVKCPSNFGLKEKEIEACDAYGAEGQ